MKQNEIDEKQLQKMFRELPEKEAPVELHNRIMREIAERKMPIRARLARLMHSSFTINIQPLRLAAGLCTLAAVFWLGLIAGERTDHTASRDIDDFQSFPIATGNAQAHYLMGRGLLTGGDPGQALRFLQRASLIDPSNPEYALWEGVALGKQNNTERERAIYRKIINRHPKYLPARMYLGHNLLEAGLLQEALREYTNVLDLYPHDETALYNRALALRLLEYPEQEAAAWKEYLQVNRSGKWAYRAVAHLNELGDFSYRSYQIGFRKIILNQNALLEDDAPARQREIDILAQAFGQSAGKELNLVLFLQDDAQRAAKKAARLKNLLDRSLEEKNTKNIKTSWFGKPETIRSDNGRQFQLPEGVLLFSQPAVQHSKEKMI